VIRAKLIFEIAFVPTDGARLPIDRSGDFGASPFLRQLSGKQNAHPHLDTTSVQDQCPCPPFSSAGWGQALSDFGPKVTLRGMGLDGRKCHSLAVRCGKTVWKLKHGASSLA
jgi:hypothetical protein